MARSTIDCQNVGVFPHSTLAPTDLKKICHKIPRAIRRNRAID